MELFFDESGGLDQDWLVFGGVAFRDRDVRRVAEREWTRLRLPKKGRKWKIDDFVALARFLRQHRCIVTGCHVMLHQELRDAVDARMRSARELQLHRAHGSETPLKAYSWLWAQMAAQFVSNFMSALVELRQVAYELQIQPDRTSMPEWQREVLRKSLAMLDGEQFRRIARSLPKGRISDDFDSARREYLQWASPSFWPHERSSTLTNIADAYCSLYVRILQGDELAKQMIREEWQITADITTDITESIRWRASLGWIESACTLSPGH